LERARVDIAAVIRRAVERLQAQADRAGVRLEIHGERSESIAPSEIVHVNADAARIEQVLQSLIHNAIKFTPAGGSVECRVDADEINVTVRVRDTGIGIAAEHLPRIFERFYKVDRGRAGGGTGLGLAIAKHTVELHGGRIWAESIEGKGTAIIFTLPRG
jgi:two-component system phosphate regulon sensor histidine kinase PhoR